MRKLCQGIVIAAAVAAGAGCASDQPSPVVLNDAPVGAELAMVSDPVSMGAGDLLGAVAASRGWFSPSMFAEVAAAADQPIK